MSYDREFEFAKELAYDAGKIMRRYFRAEDIDIQWKEDNSPLTVADTTINKLVIDRVKKIFPHHGVLGEEESFEISRNFIWVVDPIDGTAPFAMGVPISTFSIALVNRESGQPVLAVVYDPYLDHLYEARKGQGAYLNDIKLKTSSKDNLSQGFIFAGAVMKGKDKVLREEALFQHIRDQGGKIVSVAAFIYFGCKVASGELIGAVVDFASTWDLVTANLIVQEAGGISSDYNGNNQRYDQPTKGLVIAANKNIHNDLLKAVQAARS